MTDQYYDTIMGKLCTQGTDLNVSVETLREILSMIPFTTEIVPTCTEFVDNVSLMFCKKFKIIFIIVFSGKFV